MAAQVPLELELEAIWNIRKIRPICASLRRSLRWRRETIRA